MSESVENNEFYSPHGSNLPWFSNNTQFYYNAYYFIVNMNNSTYKNGNKTHNLARYSHLETSNIRCAVCRYQRTRY